MRICFVNVLFGMAMAIIAATVYLRPASANFVANNCQTDLSVCGDQIIGDNVVTQQCNCEIGLCPAPPTYVGTVGLGFYTPAPACKTGAKVSRYVVELDLANPVRGVYKTWSCAEYCEYPDGSYEGRPEGDTYFQQDITNGEDRVVPPDSGSANADATSSGGTGSSGGFLTAAVVAAAGTVAAAAMGAA